TTPGQDLSITAESVNVQTSVQQSPLLNMNTSGMGIMSVIIAVFILPCTLMPHARASNIPRPIFRGLYLSNHCTYCYDLWLIVIVETNCNASSLYFSDLANN